MPSDPEEKTAMPRNDPNLYDMLALLTGMPRETVKQMFYRLALDLPPGAGKTTRLRPDVGHSWLNVSQDLAYCWRHAAVRHYGRLPACGVRRVAGGWSAFTVHGGKELPLHHKDSPHQKIYPSQGVAKAQAVKAWRRWKEWKRARRLERKAGARGSMVELGAFNATLASLGLPPVDDKAMAHLKAGGAVALSLDGVNVPGLLKELLGPPRRR
jgi:hypothetical protein